MAYRPCQIQRSPISANIFGQSIPNTSLVTSKSSINSFQKTFEGAIFHCENKQASSLRIYCPCLYHQAIEKTFQDPSIFEPVSQDPESILTSLVDLLHRQHGNPYPWAVGHGRQLPAGYIPAKRKKEFRSGRPIIYFVDSPFRPMLNILARMIFQLIPSKSLCFRGCMHTPIHPQISTRSRRSHSCQSRPCWFLHEH